MKILSRKEWLAQVAQEIRAIKKNATKEERGKLNFREFDPQNRDYCIYGQMAEHCRSERAISLIGKCCMGVIGTSIRIGQLDKIQELKFVKVAKKRKLTDTDYLSSLEAYIYNAPRKINKQILLWIKGKTKIFPTLQ